MCDLMTILKKSIIPTSKCIIKFCVLSCIALSIIPLYSRFASASVTDRTALLQSFSPKKPYIYTLKNGLTLVIDVDNRTPIVAHTIWYKVGSADEQAGESGIAHFLEHLMFRGTKKYEAGYFSKRISEIGGEDNAFTTTDLTAYYQNIPSNHIAEIMSMEADRMKNINISEAELIKERNVVLEERDLRTDTNPTSQLIEQMSATLYRNHPYGSPVIGWKHEIEALNKTQVMAFYDKYYAPNNAIVTVVGDVVPEKILAIANETYGTIAPSNTITHRIRPLEPPQVALRTVHLTHKNVTLDNLFVMLEGISPTTRTKDFYALSTALSSIAGGVHSILYKELVKKQKLAVSVGVFASSDKLDNPPIIFQLVPTKGVSLDTLKTAFSTEMDKIIHTGLTKNDITREKNQMIADYISAFDSRGNRARLWGIGLTLGQPIDDIVNMSHIISTASDADANRTLKEIFKPNNQVWGYLQGTQQ
jgi:zinc protease